MTEPEKANILIVDDLPEKLLVYRTVLEDLGQNIIGVSSGPEALKVVLKNDFAVILLDVNMPDMDGFETAQLIRKRKRSAHTPIIFLTAFADEVRTTQGYATGGVDYIPTPVVPEILRAKVRVFVELYRLRQQTALQAQEQAKRAAAEESARRSTFLSEASRALASSLDFEATLHTLTRLAVPQLADACVVTTSTESELGRTECAWTAATGETVSQVLTSGIRLDDRIAAVLANVLRRGKLQVVPLDQTLTLLIADKSGQGAGVECAGPPFAVRHLLAMPLIARGRILGALTLALGPSERSHTPSDVALGEELANRAAVALDNAMLVRDIQEADRRKNEFLAMLAHELRNPLAPVRNAVHIMRMRGPDNPEMSWARDVIDRQVTHLVRMVDDLLDVSRITRGKIQLTPEPIDVSLVIARAVETSRPLIEAHRHQFKVSLPEEPLQVLADVTRLSQVLSNLLNNAAKYTPDGGQIDLSVSRENHQAVFRVRDSGPGIPPEMLSKIFDLFTQVSRSLDRSQGGLGIGLTLVRQLVELHDGTVEAFSDGTGQGSEFVVRLPVISSQVKAETASSEPPPSQSVKGETYRVLVVDDNVDAADSLALLLRLAGHELCLAHDGPGALDAAARFDPDVVFLDIGLPGIDGYEVARRLRAQRSDLLLVAVSGYGQEEHRNRSQQAGFDCHLTKPVSFSDLERVLQALTRPGPRLRASGS